MLVYVNIDQGIHKVKLKVAQNEKGKKIPWVFLHMWHKVKHKLLISEEDWKLKSFKIRRWRQSSSIVQADDN